MKTPTEARIIAELDCLLRPFTRDGTEGHAVLEDLAAAVSDGKGNPLHVRSALLDAKRRLRALIAETVPHEAIEDAVCRLKRLL